MKKKSNSILTLLFALALGLSFQVTAFAASGDVAGAVESTWSEASSQIKTVVNNVVFLFSWRKP